MKVIQEWIHLIEADRGSRYFRIGLALATLVFFTVGYNWRAFRNMSSQEAMDAAQLARNISEGKGYTTQFVRPLSLFLTKKVSDQSGAPLGANTDPARLKGNHPDISNPPVYPVFLAGLMKVLPFEFQLPDRPKPFWFVAGHFWRYQPDFLIAMANQVLLLGIVVTTFFLARRLFDVRLAVLASLLVLGTEMLWKFSVSGLPTLLLMLCLMWLAWCLLFLDQNAHQGELWKVIGIACAAGALTGLGALTVYSFLWLIIPVLAFISLFGGPRRWVLVGAAAVVFLLILAPWLLRNESLSGTLFGTAGYSFFANTTVFPEFKIERSIAPDLNQPMIQILWAKLMVGLRQNIREFPVLGGTWLMPFFLVGLLIGFRNRSVSRLRYFIVSGLVLFMFVQALGRTYLSEEAQGITSENLMVLFTPLIIIYGCSLFYILLDQVRFPVPQLRLAALGGFGVISCLPLLLVFLPPTPVPVVYPPYNPPAIQAVSSWVKTDELTMSDVPWAMAWYGQRQCVWYTLGPKDDFFAINDYMKPVKLLYLSPAMMDSRFLSHWLKQGDRSWGTLALESIFRRQPPDYFPLHSILNAFLPDQLVLADWDRWKNNTKK